MIDLVILDVNQTLFSLDPVAERLDEVGLPGALPLWFSRILRDGIAAAAAGGFVSFPELARYHLSAMLDEAGREGSEQDLSDVLAAFGAVSAHDDVEPGLRRLREEGLHVVTLTNGTAEITTDFLHRANLDHLVDATHDVSAVGRWKPTPEPYHFVADRHGVRPDRTALIAVHPWDVQGAVQAGLVGAWVDRDGRRYPPGFAGPTVAATSFLGAVEALSSLA